MSDNRFKIVFDGALLPGVEAITARLNLAGLFKTDIESIERLFTGRPVALKRDLSRTDAETYLLALRDAGADARIEAEQPVTFSLEKSLEAESTSPYAPPRASVGDALPEFSTLKVLTTQGRIGRLRMLAWTFVLVLIMLVACGVLFVLTVGLSFTSPTAATVIGVLAGICIFVAFLWVSILISVQRLHDLGWSGWLWFLNLVPVVSSIFPILLLVLPGNTGANRYGAPPPPNTQAVNILSILWLALLPLMLTGAILLAMSGYISRFQAL
ncbi:MAG: hypothetical protein GAK37_02770 [Pseudomonas sp.]|nr:MAG: hypothetical protein GAK37_02770 [Pseudomonas sp.]